MVEQEAKPPQDLTNLTASELVQKIKSGELSAEAVTEAHIRRIEEVNGRLNAVIVPLFDEARTRAVEADRELKNGGPVGPLHGVPVTIKEQYDVAQTETTLGVPNQAGKKADRDGPLVSRLRKAGAIILGKTNVMMTLSGWESDNPLYGRTNNPWDLDRTPGGSSGGEAAIIAARGSALGLAGDLGGSTRLPAHFCCLHGLKPTSGRLTNSGVPSRFFSSGQENIIAQPGPIARSVPDICLMMSVLTKQPLERTPDLIPPVPWPNSQAVSIDGLRVGIFTDNDVFPLAPAIRRAVEESAEVLRGKGVVVEPFAAPDMNEGWRLFLDLLSTGGKEFFQRVLAGSPPNALLKTFIMGTKTPRALKPLITWGMERGGQKNLASVVRALNGKRSAWEYWLAVEKRNDYRERFLQAMDDEQFDAIISPPYATVAPLHGATENLLPVAASYAILYNTLGMPAGVVPVTIVKEGEESDGRLKGSKDKSIITAHKVSEGSAGLPVGVQVAARHWREDIVLKIMEALEEHFKTSPTYPLNREPKP
jgi:fatty acid amide hydrolase